MKQIIVNADDFGLSEGVNKGIIHAFTNGILTSASLMANGPQFENAVLLAGQAAGLGIGVHLNAVRGRPVLGRERVRNITDRSGYFFNAPLVTFLETLRSAEALIEIENEFSAQIEKAISAGIKPTHLDTEKHLHLIPGVFRILLRLCGKYNIKGVRGFLNKPALLDFLNIRKLVFCAAGNIVSGRINNILNTQIIMPQRTFGFLESGKMSVQRYLGIFSDPYSGTAEIICHPGYADQGNTRDDGMGEYYIDKYRQAELDALAAPAVRETAVRAGVRFINYSGVSE